jgi:zinc-binding alcohol dehydrogenase/oxidoreductase
MRALQLIKIGQGPEWTTAERPQVQAGEALVKIEASALNHRDLYIREGKYPEIITPIILGSDGYGEVVEAPGATSWEGKKVVLCPSIQWGSHERYQSPNYQILGLPRPGTFAEMTTLPQANLFEAPQHLRPVEAAALPLAYLTAWRALMTRGELRQGERVLISGIGGGVASAALDIALGHGAEVYVTSSSDDKVRRAISQGAAGGFLYSDEGWGERLREKMPNGVDVVVDGAGGNNFTILARHLAPGGRLVFYGGTCGRWPALLPQHLFFRQVSLLATTMGSPREFSAMLQWIESSKTRPRVDRVFAMSDGRAAFDYLQSARQMGKVVMSLGIED